MPEDKEEVYLLKNSGVKQFVKISDMRIASDFYDALNTTVGRLIIKACMHARGEDRGTLRPSDLPEVPIP